MENRYINFTFEGFLKNFFFYILMIIVFGGSGFMMIVTIADHPPTPHTTAVGLLIILFWCLLPLGISTLNFFKKLLSMFNHAAILSPRGIKFAGEKEILWVDIKNAAYHYDDGESVSDTLLLEYKTGGCKYFDISETNICNDYVVYRAEILKIILSCI
jgi:type III secretory pathway component EscS